jgi:glycerophosphoryl diester phosphodiesterase
MHFKICIHLGKFVAGILILLLLTHCSEEAAISDSTWSGSKVMILGHRGMGTMYKMPGNTYESIAPAIAIGADGCEIDVQMTRDSVLVLFHDLTLDKKTNCSGPVHEKTYAELCNCMYSGIDGNIPVYSVDSLFGMIPELTKLYFSFDCTKEDPSLNRPHCYNEQLLRAISRLCMKYQMSGQVFIEGTSALLIRAKELGMTNKLFLFDRLDDNSIAAAVNYGFFGISTSMEGMGNKVQMAHDHGIYVMVWSPDNYSENLDALKAGADIIQTDDPISILKALERYNYDYIIP